MKFFQKLVSRIVMIVAVAFCGNASATLIDFEAQGTRPYNPLDFPIDGYVFNFTMNIYAGIDYPNAPTIDSYSALNDYGGVGTMEREDGGVFTLNSLYFRSWYSSSDTHQFVVTGYRAGAQIAQISSGTNPAGWKSLATNFTDVDLVSFQLYGNLTIFAVDNISINAVPEPETYMMLLAGLGLVGFAARRRYKS